MAKINDLREKWVVTNNTSSNIMLGDLKQSPILKPNSAYDMLKFSSKAEINQSKNLVALIASGALTLNKITDFENKEIDTTEASQSITSVEVDELEDKYVYEGEPITEETEGHLVFGKDPDGLAAPIGISGEENDEVLISDIDIEELLENIHLELVKANMQMAILTGNNITNKDIDPIQEF